MIDFKRWFALPERLDRVYNVVCSVLAAIRERNEIQSDCIVIWGKTIPWHPPEDAKSPEATEVVFSLPVSVPPGTRATVVFQPQQMFKMTRWLLLGDGALQVTDVRVGQNTQLPCGYVMAGIAGRAGDGRFDIADVGNIVAFDVRC